MATLACNSCNIGFEDDTDLKLHYKSDWHRYNLKRKVAGVPGVTKELFMARQSAIAQEMSKSKEPPMLYTCSACSKGYRSSKAHEQHLKSRSHIIQASRVSNNGEQDKPVVKPRAERVVNKPPPRMEVMEEVSEEDDEEDEWVEVDEDEDEDEDEPLVGEAAKSLADMNVDDSDSGEEDSDDDDEEEIDPSCCFMCDLEHDSIESCMVHMHKQHGFFIPDVEYLKDPEGFLTYIGLKVKSDFLCLYCNDRCQPFSSLEAVRKHMAAKGHCKVHYGDGGEYDEADLEDFYDYSSSYMDETGKEVVAANEMDNAVELVGGAELVIRRRSENKMITKTLGSREFMRYYRQQPRPTAVNANETTALLAARYRSMCLATVQSRKHLVRLKVLKEMNKQGVQQMRSKMGMKSNVIRNLPSNVPY